jgi:hypothetical protein
MRPTEIMSHLLPRVADVQLTVDYLDKLAALPDADPECQASQVANALAQVGEAIERLIWNAEYCRAASARAEASQAVHAAHAACAE